jgi:hypothetical protein
MAGGTHLRSGAVPDRRGRSEPLTATLRLERRGTISVCAARCGQGKLQLPHMGGHAGGHAARGQARRGGAAGPRCPRSQLWVCWLQPGAAWALHASNLGFSRACPNHAHRVRRRAHVPVAERSLCLSCRTFSCAQPTHTDRLAMRGDCDCERVTVWPVAEPHAARREWLDECIRHRALGGTLSVPSPRLSPKACAALACVGDYVQSWTVELMDTWEAQHAAQRRRHLRPLATTTTAPY